MLMYIICESERHSLSIGRSPSFVYIPYDTSFVYNIFQLMTNFLERQNFQNHEDVRPGFEDFFAMKSKETYKL